jgi:hypothetical protein
VEAQSVKREVPVEHRDQRSCVGFAKVVDAALQENVVAAGDERDGIGAQDVGVTRVDARAQRGEGRGVRDAERLRDRGVGVVVLVATGISRKARERATGDSGGSVGEDEAETHRKRTGARESSMR